MRTVDTDVVVIHTDKFHHMKAMNKDLNIWVIFGTGKNVTYYHISSIYEEQGAD